MNIAVAGTGYVGLSIATLLAQHYHVTAVDVVPERVDLVNNRKSPIQDDYIEAYLSGFHAEKDEDIAHIRAGKTKDLKPSNLDIQATLDGEAGYKKVEASMRFNDMTQAKNDPCFPVLGNHDLYFDCAKFYKQYFHTSTYTVTVKTVGGFQDLFILLDSGNGTFGRRQTQWLEEQLEHRDDYRHCVVISHNWLFRTSYNYTTTPAAHLPQDEQYAFMDLMSRNNVDLVLMGHFHMREQRQFGGVKYVMTDNLNDGGKPSYLVVTIGEKVTYDYEDLVME